MHKARDAAFKAAHVRAGASRCLTHSLLRNAPYEG